jgi:hypothetical protein
MQKEDWQRVIKWMGYVYLPIILLIAMVFVLVEWNAYKIHNATSALIESSRVATSTR